MVSMNSISNQLLGITINITLTRQWETRGGGGDYLIKPVFIVKSEVSWQYNKNISIGLSEWELTGRELSGWELSRVGIVRVGNFQVGIVRVGTIQAGIVLAPFYPMTNFVLA